jgi:hypothetical protein
MKFVVRLLLQFNSLRSLPREIGQLTTLEELYVRFALHDKPQSHSSKLQVSNNRLTRLPAELGLLINLRQFDVRCDARHHDACRDLENFPSTGQLQHARRHSGRNRQTLSAEEPWGAKSSVAVGNRLTHITTSLRFSKTSSSGFQRK